MVCGFVLTLAAVIVEVQADAVLVLGFSTQPAPKLSSCVALKSTVPRGLNDGLYSSASGAGVTAAVRPTTRTSPLFNGMLTKRESGCWRLPVTSNWSLSG